VLRLAIPPNKKFLLLTWTIWVCF
jgi:hypothetical protein